MNSHLANNILKKVVSTNKFEANEQFRYLTPHITVKVCRITLLAKHFSVKSCKKYSCRPVSRLSIFSPGFFLSFFIESKHSAQKSEPDKPVRRASSELSIMMKDVMCEMITNEIHDVWMVLLTLLLVLCLFFRRVDWCRRMWTSEPE